VVRLPAPDHSDVCAPRAGKPVAQRAVERSALIGDRELDRALLALGQDGGRLSASAFARDLSINLSIDLSETCSNSNQEENAGNHH
jgi:hypothetical protein